MIIVIKLVKKKVTTNKNNQIEKISVELIINLIIKKINCKNKTYKINLFWN